MLIQSIKKFMAIASIVAMVAPSGVILADEISTLSAKPNDPTALLQSADSLTNLAVNGISQDGVIQLTAQVSETLQASENDIVILETEIKKTETAFDFVASHQSEPVNLTGPGLVTASIKVSALPEGAYHWQARVKNKNNPSLVSNWVSFGGNADSPLPAISDFKVDFPPSTPTQIKASSVDTSAAIISWTNSADKDLAGIEIRRSTPTTGETIVATTGPSDINYTDIGLTEGAVYYYRLRSLDAVGNFSVFSEQAAIVTDSIIDDAETGSRITKTGLWTPATTSAGANGSVSVTQAGSGATLTYTPNIATTSVYEVYAQWVVKPTGVAGDQATDAKYTISTEGSSLAVTIDQTKLSDQLTSGANNQSSGFRSIGIFTFSAGTANTIRLDASTTGYVVADQSRFVYLRPVAPSSFIAKDHPVDNGGAIDLTWTASSSLTVTGYNVYRSTTSGSYDFTKPLGTATGTSFTDLTSATGTMFFYVVRATDRAHESTNSNETSGLAVDNLAPNPPTITSVEAGDGFVVLNWNKVDGAVGYNIRYRDPATESGFHSVFVVGGEVTSTKVTDISNNIEHEFGVSARDGVGNESDFTTVKATPQGPVAVQAPEQITVVASRLKVGKATISPPSDQVLEPEPQKPEEGKIKAAEDSKQKRERAAVTVAILVIAVAAGVAGYYGYDWWLRKTQEAPDKTKGKNGRW